MVVRIVGVLRSKLAAPTTKLVRPAVHTRDGWDGSPCRCGAVLSALYYRYYNVKFTTPLTHMVAGSAKAALPTPPSP